MMKKILKTIPLVIYLWLAMASAYAQTGTIKGKVMSGGSALEFVNIGLKNTDKGSATASNGSFEIDQVSYGRYKIVASMIGFKRTEKWITVSKEQPIAVVNFDLEESAETLNEVVVSGTMKEVSKLKSSVPVEVYSKLFFKANPSPSVFDAIQNINGVRPQVNCNVCNTGDIHINGLDGPYTMVLIDGMPIVSGLSTVYGLTGIPQSLIERMEVVKGPASTLYGSEAVGGLINIITKNPAAAPKFSADIFGTTWGEVNTDLGLTYKAGQKTKGLLGVNYFNYENPIDNNDDGFTDLTLQNRISIFNKLSFQRPENRQFSLAARYIYEDRWGGEMNWNPSYRGGDEVYGESIYTSRWEAFGIYQLPTTEHINFQFSANGHHQNSAYGNTLYLADQYIGFGQLVWNKEVQAHDLTVGLAYRYTYYDDNTPATAKLDSTTNDPSITHLPGAFVQDEITFNATNKLLLGLRYDYNSIHGNILTPRINYKWNTPDQTTIVRLSAGNGYRVANVFTEDHAALTGAREVVFEDDLDPETSWNVNINAVHKIYSRSDWFLNIDASAFYTYFMNNIIADYDTDPNKIIYDNLNGHAISKGVSLNLDMSWANGLKIMAGATLMDVSVEEDGVTYQQMLTEKFSGVWNIGYTFNQANITVNYTGSIYGPMRLPLLGDLDDRPEYSSTYSLQNIQLTKTFNSHWEVYGGIKNLLNFTPPSNSIARAFDPFDKNVVFDEEGQVVPTEDNPNALTFDPSYVYAPNQGIRGFLGVRYTIE